MPRIPLTPRPRVPVLVHATALGTLAFASAACGDDGGGTSTTNVSTTDTYPTAGPCYHQNPPPAECASTGPAPGTTSSDTGSGSSTGSSSVADAATDIPPTAGPCFHDPQAPECASTTDGGSDSGTATEGPTGTGTGTSSGG
jgi:hypothetical protein